MKKEELKLFILQTLLEVIEDTNNYAPDKWEHDFEYAVERKIRQVSEKVK